MSLKMVCDVICYFHIVQGFVKLVKFLLFNTDINECGTSDTCDADYGICTNTEPGYTCSCPTGFLLGSNQRTCTGKSDLIERSPFSKNFFSKTFCVHIVTDILFKLCSWICLTTRTSQPHGHHSRRSDV
mgnify:CR=1 FL=1